MHKQDYQSILVLGPQCVKLVESIHGKNSAEYIETKKQFISSCMMVNNYNLAYKECLEAYDEIEICYCESLCHSYLKIWKTWEQAKAREKIIFYIEMKSQFYV